MTQKQIIYIIETTLNEKITKNPNYIRYTFYEVNIKYHNEYGLEKQDLGMFLQLLRTKLKNDNYHVYTEGQKFEYKDANITVQSNEVLVATKVPAGAEPN